MHHWTVHTKVEFPRFPPDVRTRGVHSITFDPEHRNELKKFSILGGIHSTTFNPELRNEFKIFSNPGGSHSITFYPELRNELRIFSNPGGVHSTSFDPELRNESFALISFMGLPAILSALQTFQICIFNRKNSKLTFSNGSQLMGKKFMANLHASLDSRCKSRFSKISTRCQNQGGVHSTTFDPEHRNELKKISNPGGSIPQLLILNSEMNLKILLIWGSLPQLLILK